MGCGSSSLKGNASSGATANAQAEPKPGPAKEIRHQFDSVDYDSGATGERRHTAYAPHETSRHPSVAAPSEHRPPSSRGGGGGGPKAALPSNVATTLPLPTQPMEGLAPPVQSHVPSNIPTQQPLEPPTTYPQQLNTESIEANHLAPNHNTLAPPLTTSTLATEHLNTTVLRP